MGRVYSITITNHASRPDSFMLFQTPLGDWEPGAATTIAWFAQYSSPSPDAAVKFWWTTDDIGFAWADSGPLQPGAVFQPVEIVDTMPPINQWTLTYQNHTYTFIDPRTGPNPASRYLTEDRSIPADASASVGITMAGSTFCAFQARPFWNIAYSPHPRVPVFLAYGDYAQGDVIDASTIENPLKLVYEPGVYSLYTTLNPDNRWSPPTPEAGRAPAGNRSPASPRARD